MFNSPKPSTSKPNMRGEHLTVTHAWYGNLRNTAQYADVTEEVRGLFQGNSNDTSTALRGVLRGAKSMKNKTTTAEPGATTAEPTTTAEPGATTAEPTTKGQTNKELFNLGAALTAEPASRPMDVVMQVLTRRGAFERRSAIRGTWASGHNNVFFFLGHCCPVPPGDRKEWSCERAKPSTPAAQALQDAACAGEDARLAEEAATFKDIIFIPDVVDSYRTLPEKVKYFYKWGVENTQAKWFVKLGDDMYTRVAAYTDYLMRSDAYLQPTVVGCIARGWEVRRSGQWAELKYKPDVYPPFPAGSCGHALSRPLAIYIADNYDSLTIYQGEDVSVGIWLDESPLKLSIKWVHSPHHTLGGDCTNPDYFIIGHQINSSKMKLCFAHEKSAPVVVEPAVISTEKSTFTNMPPPEAEWCANEHGTCTCRGAVYYGRDTTFVSRLVRGPIPCTNPAFMLDPIPGAKKCFCLTKNNDTSAALRGVLRGAKSMKNKTTTAEPGATTAEPTTMRQTNKELFNLGAALTP